MKNACIHTSSAEPADAREHEDFASVGCACYAAAAAQ